MIKSVRIKFDKLLHDTGNAILVRIGNKDYWIGKFMFKNLVINNKLGGHLSISPKICDEKGICWDEIMADVTITKHIPKKKKIETRQEPNELLR